MELTHISKTVLEKRYLRLKADGSRETPDDMLRRVAGTIASMDALHGAKPKDVKATEEAFYNLMDRQDFMPNSPTFTGAGTSLGQLSACFVLPVGDSLTEIYETMKQAALIHQTGGGTGFAFSRLRPSGDKVRSSQGVASGPVSFLRVYNASTEAIKQGGTRRGANMGILRVDHPDIVEFIQSKEDTTQITNFNISVGITDAFMAALEAGGEYDLINPRDGEPIGKLSAKMVWDKLVDCAWRTGEPGVVFIDRMNRRNPNNHAETIEATNPCGEQPLPPFGSCFAKGTRISTERGLEKVEDLLERYQRGEEVVIATQLNGAGNRIVYRPAAVLYTGYKDTVRLTLANGQQLRLTPEHQVFTEDGWKEAGSLTPDDRVMIQNGSRTLTATSSDEEVRTWRMLGWFTGDGWFTDNSMGLVFSQYEQAAREELLPVWQSFSGTTNVVQRQDNGVTMVQTERQSVREALHKLGFSEGRGPAKRVPVRLFTLPTDLQAAYLQGLFSADGTKRRDRSEVSLASGSLELLRDVQLLMLNLGISSNITWYPVRKKGHSQGSVHVAGENFQRWADLIGFPLVPEKQARLESYNRQRIFRSRRFIQVESVEPAGFEHVYDLSEPVTHSLIAEGMVVHNCNLGSINLAGFVKNPYTQAAEVNWDRLGEVARLTAHFLDNVIDANKYPLPQIADKARRDRRIGLGVMGWAEMLVQMGYAYDSDEAVQLGRDVMTFIKRKAMEMSMELAEKRGAYPEWEGSQWQQAGFKVRNATLTTVAPTGTISLFAAKPAMPCSGGIEPKFALVFTRNQAGAIMLDIDGQFETIARQEGWYSEELMKQVAEHGTARGVEGVPERWQQVFATSHDITPEWHVRMQGAFQGSDDLPVDMQPVDAAVSKTINFANYATREDVQESYSLAWELGLKGITVYRDGSRAFQVLTSGNKTEEKKEEAPAPQPVAAAPAKPVGPALQPRPVEANGKMFVIPTHFGKMTLDVHMDDDGEPFEIIVNVGAAGSDLMADAVGMGMLVSKLLRLRSDVPVRERIEIVIDTMKNIGGSGSYGFGPNRVTSLASAIAKGLQRFLAWKDSQNMGSPSNVVALNSAAPAEQADHHHAPTAMAGAEIDRHVDPCPECGSHALAVGEGCCTCHNCGYSKCS